MENAIHVGNKVTKETAENIERIISKVFESGHKNHMDQETIQAALEVVAKAVKVENVNITNSSFNGDKVVNMGEED